MPKGREPEELHSMKCLRVVEGLNGGRGTLAIKLGLTRHALDNWFRNGKVSPGFVAALVRLGSNKVTADELLGLKD